MPHSVHTITIAEALQRVFLPALRNLPTTLHCVRKPLHLQNNPRHASTRSHAGHFDLSGKFVSSAKFGPKLSPTTKARPRDEAINADSIHLVEADERLSPPQSLGRLLHEIDRETHMIEQHSELDGIPICKVVDKAEARAAEKQRQKAKPKNAEQMKKYLELNWAIDQNDLQHRLGKLREFLMQGRRVEVYLAKKKKRMRDATAAEGRETLKKIQECVKGLDGAKELKAMEGKFLEKATLFFEGKRAKQQGKTVDEGNEAATPETQTAMANIAEDNAQGQEEEESVEQDEPPQRVAFG